MAIIKKVIDEAVTLSKQVHQEKYNTTMNKKTSNNDNNNSTGTTSENNNNNNNNNIPSKQHQYLSLQMVIVMSCEFSII